MCLAIPGKILSISSPDDPCFRSGVVSFGGIKKEVNLVMVPEATVNDYVIVHAGVALNKIDQEEAEKLWTILKNEAGDEL